MKLVMIAALALAVCAGVPARAATDIASCVTTYGALASEQRTTRAARRSPLTALASNYFEIDYAARQQSLVDRGDAALKAGTMPDGSKIADAVRKVSGPLLTAEVLGDDIAKDDFVNRLLTAAKDCDAAHGFAPALLLRSAPVQAAVLDEKACVGNYIVLMLDQQPGNPAYAQAVGQRADTLSGRYVQSHGGETPQSFQSAVMPIVQAKREALSTQKITPASFFEDVHNCDQKFGFPPLPMPGAAAPAAPTGGGKKK